MNRFKRSFVSFAIFSVAAGALFAPDTYGKKERELWREVEVIRTAYGVPHIRAENLRAAGYALAWLQCEDYGTVTPMEVLEASGRWSTVEGYQRIESDFVVQRQRDKTAKNYPSLSKDVREVYEGFAAGVNRFIELHRGDFPKWMPADFTGVDVAATEIIPPSSRKIRLFLNRLNPPTDQQPQTTPGDEGAMSDEGSNSWAFAPSRTKSGKAILLRNPHLQWSAGYYEAHMTVPGVVDFYGDFRIGGPFSVIGGFNKDLGWSTTNNSQDLDDFYSFDADPNRPDSYMLDGRSIPLTRELRTISFRNGDALATETREFWSTQFGPVVHRADGKIYIFRYVGDGEYRNGEQFLRMMRSKSLDEWKNAMKLRARPTSNFTYADRAGNIFFIWNATLPLLVKPPADELAATHVKTASEIWTKFVPFESLPQILNPPGGYIHNENSSPHFTNIRGPVNTQNPYPNFERPSLSLRSQLALQLIAGDEKFSLEDVIRLKHNYRMLLADRVKNDLVAAVKATNATGDVANAVQLLERWDNTASPESRGSTLFEIWWLEYSGFKPGVTSLIPDNRRFARVWNVDDPYNTPRGLADPKRAVESFIWAIEEAKRLYGAYDVAWGDVHRVRRGKTDVPVGGCGNEFGCFRILGFTRDKDSKLAATVGDGWVLAVEFGDAPRAYSVLAYGQSRLPSSPWHADQAEMFARGEMKKVAFTKADIDSQAVVRFHPGESKKKVAAPAAN